jgi:hypothetical protein
MMSSGGIVQGDPRWLCGAMLLMTMSIAPVLCGQSHPAVELGAQMRAAVAAQATCDLSLSALHGSGGVDTSGVELVPGPAISGGIKLWRARIWSLSHWPPYLLGSHEDQFLRLGGFTAPDVEEATSLLGTRIASLKDARAYAQTLATLLDPNAASALIFPSVPDSSSYARAVIATWRRASDKNWPEDSSASLPGRTYSVRITVLSREMWAQGEVWMPIGYSFRIDAQGRLMAWAKRLGESFAGPR